MTGRSHKGLRVAVWLISWLLLLVGVAMALATIHDGFVYWPSELTGLGVLLLIGTAVAVPLNLKRPLVHIFLIALGGALVLRACLLLFQAAFSGWFYLGSAEQLANLRLRTLSAGILLLAAGLCISLRAKHLLPRRPTAAVVPRNGQT